MILRAKERVLIPWNTDSQRVNTQLVKLKKLGWLCQELA
jgi:hypothetical protein